MSLMRTKTLEGEPSWYEIMAITCGYHFIRRREWVTISYEAAVSGSLCGRDPLDLANKKSLKSLIRASKGWDEEAEAR